MLCKRYNKGAVEVTALKYRRWCLYYGAGGTWRADSPTLLVLLVVKVRDTVVRLVL